MKKVLFMALSVIALFAFTSCENDDENEVRNQTIQHYWQEYPKSYVRFCDYRFDFRLLRCERRGSSVAIEYVMTNRYFNKDVETRFYLDGTPAHDNLGNAYKNHTDVVAYINGTQYSDNYRVKFVPNQAIKGSFTIKNFDINATMVSVGCHVRCDTKDFSFDHDMIEFVNMPIDVPISLVEM